MKKAYNDFREIKKTWNKYYVNNNEALALLRIYRESTFEKEKIKDAMIRRLDYLIYAKIKGYKKCFYYEELLQEGRIGLMKAMEDFDFTRGINFFKFARWHIQSRITRLLNWHKRNKMKEKTIKESIQVENYGPGPDDQYEVMESAKVLRNIIDGLPDVDKKVLIMRFGLDGFDEHTLKQVGEIFSISKQRVEQIEKKAMLKLKKNNNFKRFFCEL